MSAQGDIRTTEIRSCRKCSAAAVRVVHITDHYNRGIPTGRSYDHRCAQCQNAFRTFSTWGTITEYLMGVMLVFFGFFMFVFPFAQIVSTMSIQGMSGGMWFMMGLGALLLFGGLAWVGFTTWAVAQLFMNPVANRS